MKGLNLAGFKKIAEDKKTATMRHEKGHEIKLALGSLSSLQREQIKRIKLADGGNILSNPPQPAQPPANQDPQKVVQATDSMRKAFNFDDGTPDGDVGSTAQASLRIPASVMNDQDDSEPITGQQQEAQKTLGGIGQGMSAINQQQALSGQEAQANLPAYKTQLETNQDIAARNQKAQDVVNTAAKSYSDYVNANPLKDARSKYMDAMPVGQKITTALGLLVGGFDGGFSGQGGNTALDYLESKIKQNIDLQQKDIENKKSAFGAFHSAFQDNAIASNLASANAKEQLANQLDITAAKFGTQQAAINAAKNKQVLMSGSINDRNQAAALLADKYKNGGNMGGGAAPQQPQSKAPVGIQQIVNPQAPKPSGMTSAQNTQPPSFSDVWNHPENSEAMKMSQMGLPQANASESVPEKPEPVKIYHILSPHADSIIHSTVQNGTDAQKADYATVNDQMTKADQLEKVLNGPKNDGAGGIHEIFQNLYKNSGEGNPVTGLGGALQRAGSRGLGAVTGVAAHLLGAGPLGDAAGAVAGNALSIPAMTEAQKQYEINQGTLKTDLASALNGIISVNDVNALVDRYSPGYNDSPGLVKQKEQQFVNSLIKAAKTTQLKHYKMTTK